MKYETRTRLDDLVGRQIQHVWIGDDVLEIAANGEHITICLTADCCSESWWSDAYGVASIIGKTVVQIEDAGDDKITADYNLDDGRGRQEEDKLYHFGIRVEDGSLAIFIFRNSSNGYYGGAMQDMPNVPAEAREAMRDLTERDTWRNNTQSEK